MAAVNFLTAPLCLLLSYIVYIAVAAIYNLYFHPLSGYPCDPLAISLPSVARFHRIVFRPSAYVFELEKLHKTHGPVVRNLINSLHINDPEVYLQITKVGSGFRKDVNFYGRITFLDASVGMLDVKQHRARQSVLMNAAFGPKQVQELARVVESKTAKLLSRFRASAAAGEPANVHRGCKALSMDIISQITMGKEFGCLEHPEYKNLFMDALHSVFTKMSMFRKIMHMLSGVSPLSPRWMWKVFNEPTMVIMRELAKPIIRDYLERRSEMGDDVGIEQRSTVIDALTDPDTKEGKPTDFDTLAGEVVTLLTGGGDTSSSAMILGIYKICREPEVYRRLTDELLTAFPSQKSIGYDEARTLPYLNAVIKEVLRVSNPLPGRLPRVVPPEGFLLYGQQVPPGTIIGTSAYLINRHPSIWREPDKFDPERWLQPESKNLEQYMASFYRGTRQCLGKDLAWCEFYVLFANLFRQFDINIHDTTDADMEWKDQILIVFKGKDFQACLAPRNT